MSLLEAIAALFGVANILLIVRRSVWNFPAALVMVSLTGIVLWDARLYSDAGLQVFFFVVNILGWVLWVRNRGEEGEIVVERMGAVGRIVWIAVALVAIYGWGWFMAINTNASWPWWDASVAMLSVAAGEDGLSVLTGGWTSREWVPHVTAFFEGGGCRVLVGTRGLLGEGWDARSVSGLVDLTAATTSTAVVQTRGRALRVDPTWPDKVALTWSVVCVAPAHPRGGNDWDRLVRKHTGFYGVDDAGDVVDGVGHLDAAFSPFAPPEAEGFDAVNDQQTAAAVLQVGGMILLWFQIAYRFLTWAYAQMDDDRRGRTKPEAMRGAGTAAP